MKERLLFLLMLSLYFMVLLFEYFSIMLRNVKGGREKHYDTEARVKKKVPFYLCIVNLSTITGFSDKLNRTLKAQS